MTVGSLFAGIGGIDLAFLQTGCNVLWAIECDHACCKTYRHHFRDTPLIESDVRAIDPKALPRINVLTAGFPCQPFSVAGKRRGFSDPRGQLIYEVGRFVGALQPEYVLLENVPHLLEHDNGKSFLTVHDILSECGYSIRYRVLRASEYGGIPQIRDRVFLIAFKDQEQCDRFCFPDKMQLAQSIEDVIHRNIKQNDVYYYREDDPFYRKAAPIVRRKDSVYRVYHESIKITQNYMCPTLTASMGTRNNQVPLIIDDYGMRKLTLRECLAFQGFPPDFYFPRSITLEDAYKQIGNSVCVPVVRRLAEKIMQLAQISNEQG